MRLRTKYILFVAVLHIVALVLSYFVFFENKILFIVSEVFIIISVLISWQLYNQLIQPLKLLMQGTDAIKDRDFNIKFLATGKFEMDQLINVYNEMIDELRLERTKQEQQHLFLEKLIHTSPTGILILDYDGKIKQANPKGLQLLEVHEKDLVGKTLDESTHPVILKIKNVNPGEAQTITLNGGITYKLQKSHFIDRGFARQFVMIEELTAEILAAEKKTYGKVIRMMAHEVNNTIGPVNSILQSTLQAGRNNEAIDNALVVAMQRNNNLNVFMRNFADLVRIPPPVKKPVDLVALMNNVVELSKVRSGNKKIVFEKQYDANSFIISADLQQLEQAFINIIKNAIEAIDEEGSITIVTNTRSRQMVIRDSGKGIRPQSEENLFSPFYSTKKDGQGIGLALIKEILINHGFEFSLKTTSPGITEFKISNLAV
jgi:two-component system nitrogen regulation sensor histidine kinase NtrY